MGLTAWLDGVLAECNYYFRLSDGAVVQQSTSYRGSSCHTNSYNGQTQYYQYLTYLSGGYLYYATNANTMSAYICECIEYA